MPVRTAECASQSPPCVGAAGVGRLPALDMGQPAPKAAVAMPVRSETDRVRVRVRVYVKEKIVHVGDADVRGARHMTERPTPSSIAPLWSCAMGLDSYTASTTCRFT